MIPTKKILICLLMAVCIAVFAYSGYQLYIICADYGAADQAYEDAAAQFVTPAESDADLRDAPDMTIPVHETASPVLVDFDALLGINSNVVGWIYCPDTPINYPIVQTENNSDYLRRLLDGTYNRSGTIFLDYRNDSGFQSFNSIIYGHNMGNGKMFAPLMNYRQQAYYDAHPVMYLLTPDGDYRLDILAGALVDANSNYYATAHTEESFRSFLDQICRTSTFQSDVKISTVERTVMLSTCTNTSEDGRYILVCALVPVES